MGDIRQCADHESLVRLVLVHKRSDKASPIGVTVQPGVDSVIKTCRAERVGDGEPRRNLLRCRPQLRNASLQVADERCLLVVAENINAKSRGDAADFAWSGGRSYSSRTRLQHRVRESSAMG